MNSVGCLVSCLAFAASHGVRLLHVFLPAWLDAPIFGGANVGTGWFFPTNYSLVRPIVCFNTLRLCVLYFSTTSRFHNESYSRVSPLYRQFLKLLGEVSPYLINLMALYIYFCIEFHNFYQLAPFFCSCHILNFRLSSDRWSFFQCTEFSKCAVCRVVVEIFFSSC
jgi:hypothetical protein